MAKEFGCTLNQSKNLCLCSASMSQWFLILTKPQVKVFLWNKSENNLRLSLIQGQPIQLFWKNLLNLNSPVLLSYPYHKLFCSTIELSQAWAKPFGNRMNENKVLQNEPVVSCVLLAA